MPLEVPSSFTIALRSKSERFLMPCLLMCWASLTIFSWSSLSCSFSSSVRVIVRMDAESLRFLAADDSGSSSVPSSTTEAASGSASLLGFLASFWVVLLPVLSPLGTPPSFTVFLVSTSLVPGLIGPIRMSITFIGQLLFPNMKDPCQSCINSKIFDFSACFSKSWLIISRVIILDFKDWLIQNTNILLSIIFTTKVLYSLRTTRLVENCLL
mmetsp:Transcript_55112/g.120157  ORF Transcript_55112/g.120157 Transcript_55112/m.120157 type:complete len:212 (-) Transcript_55112:737-1372(-)